MKDKIVEILNRNGIYHEASKLRIANTIDQLYEQEAKERYENGKAYLRKAHDRDVLSVVEQVSLQIAAGLTEKQ